MGVRQWLSILMTLLSITSTLLARQEQAQDITFSPTRFYLGDEVLLNFWIPTAAEERLTSGLYPQNDHLIVEEIQLIPMQQRTYISVRFRSFNVGRQYLELQFDELTLEPILITTQSLIAEGYDQPRTIYGPKLLEHTQTFIIIFSIIILLVIPLTLLTIGVVKRLYAYYRSGKMLPYRFFIKTLTQLIRSASQLDDAQYYSQLTQAVRLYLTHQLDIPVLIAATPPEVESLLISYYDKESAHRLASLLQRSDAIRFGGRFAEVGERESDTNFVLALAKQAERWRSGEVTK